MKHAKETVGWVRDPRYDIRLRIRKILDLLSEKCGGDTAIEATLDRAFKKSHSAGQQCPKTWKGRAKTHWQMAIGAGTPYSKNWSKMLPSGEGPQFEQKSYGTTIKQLNFSALEELL